MWLLILLAQGIVFGAFCAYIAGEKGRSTRNWFWLGFFFSLVALISIGTVPAIRPQSTGGGTGAIPGTPDFTASISRTTSSKTVAPSSWTCGQCGNLNPPDIQTCAKCGGARHG